MLRGGVVALPWLAEHEEERPENTLLVGFELRYPTYLGTVQVAG